MKQAILYRLILATLFVCGLIVPASADDHLTISIIDYPPISYYDYEFNIGKGMVTEIVSEALTIAGLKPIFNPMPMARGAWSVTKGEHSAILGLVRWFEREGNEAQIDSVEIFNLNFELFYKKERFPDGLTFNQLEELRSYTIGNVRGSATTELLGDALLNIQHVTNIEQNFRMLESDRIDLAIAVDLAGWHIIQTYFPGRMDEFASTNISIYQYPLALIFDAQDQELKSAFKKGMDTIRENGRYSEIFQDYMNGKEFTNQ